MKPPVIALKRRGNQGVWYVRYIFNGKREHFSLGTMDEGEARKMVTRIQYEIETDIHQPQKRMIFDNLLREYMMTAKEHKAESSYVRDQLSAKYLTAFFHGRRIDQLTLKDGELYQSLRKDGKLNVAGVSRKDKYSLISINRECRLLITVFNKAIAWDLLDKNPFRFLKLFKEEPRIRYVRTEEWPLLLSAAKPFFRYFLVFARATGLRLGEILNCQWKDIDWNLNHVTVIKSKNNTPRTIPLNPLLQKILENMRKTAQSDYLFPSANKDRDSWLKHAFRSVCRKTGIVNLRIHDIRHTFASDMINAGVDLPTLMKLMGHKTIQTTMRYIHLYPDHVRDAILKSYEFYRQTGPNWDQIDDDE